MTALTRETVRAALDGETGGDWHKSLAAMAPDLARECLRLMDVVEAAERWRKFGEAVMDHWPLSSPDGFELQDLAENHGLIAESPVPFDPEIHGPDPYEILEKGDTFFLRTYLATRAEGGE